MIMNYDTDLIDENVMDKDESESEGDELVRIRSTRQKLMPACYKECFFEDTISNVST